jgi:hypothetical protein
MPRFAALILACAVLAGHAEAQAPRRLDELLAKSGAYAQLGLFEKLIQAGMDQAASEAAAQGKRSTFTPEDRARIRAIVSSCYSPQRMRQEIRASIGKSITAADETQVLAWLNTDLGKRVAALDVQHMEMQILTDPRQFAREVDAARKGLTQTRVDLLRRLGSALSMGETTARTVTSIFTSILIGATTAMNENVADAASVKANLEARQHLIAHSARQGAVANYALEFKSLDDGELEQFVSFVETPAGLKYSDALAAAIEASVTRASGEFGRQVGELGKQRAEARKASGSK